MESNESKYLELVQQTANEIIKKKGHSSKIQISYKRVVHQNNQRWVEVGCTIVVAGKANNSSFNVQFYEEETNHFLIAEVEKGIEDCLRTYQNFGI